METRGPRPDAGCEQSRIEGSPMRSLHACVRTTDHGEMRVQRQWGAAPAHMVQRVPWRALSCVVSSMPRGAARLRTQRSQDTQRCQGRSGCHDTCSVSKIRDAARDARLSCVQRVSGTQQVSGGLAGAAAGVPHTWQWHMKLWLNQLQLHCSSGTFAKIEGMRWRAAAGARRGL